MTFKIFTYGLNLNSLSRTLGRDVAKDEFVTTSLSDYAVSWGYGMIEILANEFADDAEFDKI